VEELDPVARARGTDVHREPAHHVEERLDHGHLRRVAADHEEDLARLRLGGRAEHRRVEVVDSARLRRPVDLDRDARAHGRAVAR
jgi:hypothetical protein